MERATGLVSPIRHRRPRLPRSSVRSPRCASDASRSTAGRYSATWPLAREPAGGHTRTAARARAAASVATPTATRTSSRLWCAPTHLATAPHRHRPSPPPPFPPAPSTLPRCAARHSPPRHSSAAAQHAQTAPGELCRRRGPEPCLAFGRAGARILRLLPAPPRGALGRT